MSSRRCCRVSSVSWTSLVLTVAPMFVGGWRSVQSRIGEMGLRLHDMSCEMCGGDVILHAFTSPSSLTQLSASAESAAASTSLSTIVSDLSSSFHRTSTNLQRSLAPAVSHVLEPYNALVYSSVAFPPLVLLCHSFLRLRAIRRLLPSSTVQHLDRWTRWRVSLLMPALLLLAHYLVQQWTASGRYDWMNDTAKRLLQTRQVTAHHEQEMRAFPSLSLPATASSIVSSLSTASPFSQPVQSYLLPFTSSSAASRPPAPAPLPHLFSASSVSVSYAGHARCYVAVCPRRVLCWRPSSTAGDSRRVVVVVAAGGGSN